MTTIPDLLNTMLSCWLNPVHMIRSLEKRCLYPLSTLLTNSIFKIDNFSGLR